MTKAVKLTEPQVRHKRNLKIYAKNLRQARENAKLKKLKLLLSSLLKQTQAQSSYPKTPCAPLATPISPVIPIKELEQPVSLPEMPISSSIGLHLSQVAGPSMKTAATPPSPRHRSDPFLLCAKKNIETESAFPTSTPDTSVDTTPNPGQKRMRRSLSDSNLPKR